MSLSRSVALLAVCLCALAAGPLTAVAEVRILWRVENPFRFFTDPADTEMHRAAYMALADDERAQPVLAAERALAELHDEGWAAVMTGAVCWDGAQNLHACPTAQAYINPTTHAVLVEATGIAASEPVECTWLTAPRGRRPGRGVSVTRPCSDAIRLEIPYPGGADVTLEVGGRRIASERVVVEDLFIAGIGDSFGSGEGNPDLPTRFSRERAFDYGKPSKGAELVGYPARAGTWQRIGDEQFVAANARWLDQACHRSLYSHQLRAALQIAIEHPHRAVTYVGFACSGAEVTFGLFLRYKGHEWVPNPPALSQISALAEAQCGEQAAPMQDLPEAYHLGGRIPELQGGLTLKKCEHEHARKLDLLLLSIGGNDIGFSRLVANAVLADESTLKRLGGWFGQVHGPVDADGQLKALEARYRSLRRAIHNLLHVPWTEPGRVILTAYPGLALMEDGRSVCPDGQAGMDVLADFRLSEERARESSAAAERLNATMKAAARENGWTLVEAHRRQFQGRGLCAGHLDNAFSSADDLRLPRKVEGRWQPYNPADYRAYARRQRWFRTPNDAFMTGNFHISGSVLQSALRTQSLSWFQLLLASTYSGAFHPTAEGHAAIADAVVTEARRVLARYDGRERAP
jgi:hypothetical protein